MRRSFAALLVILLLAMTSWASACDLSCSLERVHSICKLPGTAASVEGTVPSSDMANMDMPDESSVTSQPESDGLVHQHINSCTHSPCNETSVSAISKSAAQHSVPALQLIVFERPTVAAITRQVTGASPEKEPPDLQPFDPLSVNLRI
jgi:hypothetical protein